MTKKHSTKKALMASVLSLLLCFSMLIGTTFAWFTDSVTSANNIIKSGNLDIELEYWNGTDWVDVAGKSDILTNTLWEPGVAEVAYLRVANAGSLALKYQLGVNILNEIEGKNQAGDTFRLSDYILFGVVEGVNGETGAYAKDSDGRAAAIAAAAASVNGVDIISAGYTKETTMNPEDELYLALVVYMPTEIGNIANHNGTDVPQIDLGINILATQTAVEADSFDNQYDANAWTEVAEVPTPDANGVVNIYTAEQLAGIMSNVSATSGIKEINIIEDVDLAGRTWVAAEVAAPGLVINGNGHTIFNMSVKGKDNQGFISHVKTDLIIKDLTFKDAKVDSTGSFVGGVIANINNEWDVTLDNVDVIDSEITTTVDNKAIRVGALVGYSSYIRGDLNLKDCDVTGCTVAGYHNVGAMIGTTMFNLNGERDTVYVTNCTAKNNTLKYGSTNVGAFAFGASTSGYTEYAPAGFTAENNKTVAIVNVNSDLQSLITKGVTNIELPAGEYTLPGNSDIVIVGSGSETVIDINGAIHNANISNATITGATEITVLPNETAVFENVIFDSKLGGASGGQYGSVTGSVTFKGCTFEKMLHFDNTNNANILIEDCTFGVLGTFKMGAGAANIVVKNTTFNTTTSTSIWGEKGIVVYCPTTFTDCEFNNRAVVVSPAGLSVTFNSCTMEGGKPVYYVDNTDGIIRGGNVPNVTINN